MINSEIFQANLLESLIDPHIPTTQKQLRSRSSPTKIKALYHLYQLDKNVKNGKWSSNYQGKTRIAKDAKISKKHFSEFVNSGDFKLFGSIQHRPGTSNIYRLQNWIILFFDFLERKGMMKFFRKNFDLWKRNFMNRFHKWLLPLLNSGYSLNQILMNKVVNKKSLKGDGYDGLKGDAIKPSGSMKPSGSKSNTEFSVPAYQEFVFVGEQMSRFGLREGDINSLLKRYSLNRLKKASYLMHEWKNTGMEFRSPVRIYQTCLNKTV